MTKQKLDIMQTIKDGVQYGLKNFFPLLLMVILYLITFWIPWLNVGTTIGLYKAVIGIGRGETVDPTSIFDKENFQNIGKFFLLLGFLFIGITAAAFFMLIPAIVMGIAWGFAIYFIIDKKVSPLKALGLSYDTTYGNKWRIFGVGVVCGIIISVCQLLLGLIPKVGPVLSAIVSILAAAIMLAVDGVMYDFFSKIADNILAEKAGCGCHAAPDEPEAEAAPAAEEPAPAPQERDHSAYMPTPDEPAE